MKNKISKTADPLKEIYRVVVWLLTVNGWVSIHSDDRLEPQEWALSSEPFVHLKIGSSIAERVRGGDLNWEMEQPCLFKWNNALGGPVHLAPCISNFQHFWQSEGIYEDISFHRKGVINA